MTTVAIVQARLGSVRFPRKVLRNVCGTTLIGLLLNRLAKARNVDSIIVATTDHPRDHALIEHVRELGFEPFAGSENDVLERYYRAAMKTGADTIVRITGDCPLVDPEIVSEVVDHLHKNDLDYATNTMPPTYPDGLDVEVFRFGALERAWREAAPGGAREHVTPFIREDATLKRGNLANDYDLSGERWTVDDPADLEVITNVFEHFHPRRDFSWTEVKLLLEERPEYFLANRTQSRNEGAILSSGQKLWRRAKRVIPGGNMLLSKRPEMFLPDRWPAYFTKTRGCRVWDLDGTEYIDMSLMGIGTNLLGYSHPAVDAAVSRVVQDGNMSTLNCPEEVYLAERLIDIHPWADMVRLARTGGEANAVAIRVARAATGKDNVAFCGYHGWHDWYLAANVDNRRNLDAHLLPDLAATGVPDNLAGTVFPFAYNDYSALETIVDSSDIGVVMMEVVRNIAPEDDFLRKVRKLTADRGIVLIFDECTSGFRQTFGGLHLQFEVTPDMAIFGKALGNGYAITAIIGRRAVMEAAQSTFISSTFWSERIGPAAALATLDVMEQTLSWEQVTATGRRIRTGWKELAARHDLEIETSGLPALGGFSFRAERNLEYKTLISQEMLTRGFLAGTHVYVSTAHTPDVVDAYFDALDPVFDLLRQCEDGRDVHEILQGSPSHAGLRRLN
jgi:glutamate-1-semialdehyde 2,1-aminomutase